MAKGRLGDVLVPVLRRIDARLLSGQEILTTRKEYYDFFRQALAEQPLPYTARGGERRDHTDETLFKTLESAIRNHAADKSKMTMHEIFSRGSRALKPDYLRDIGFTRPQVSRAGVTPSTGGSTTKAPGQ
jgi:hypothetical protein